MRPKFVVAAVFGALLLVVWFSFGRSDSSVLRVDASCRNAGTVGNFWGQLHVADSLPAGWRDRGGVTGRVLDIDDDKVFEAEGHRIALSGSGPQLLRCQAWEAPRGPAAEPDPGQP